MRFVAEQLRKLQSSFAVANLAAVNNIPRREGKAVQYDAAACVWIGPFDVHADFADAKLIAFANVID